MGEIADALKPRPGDPSCSRCGRALLFSARKKGNGLCGRCDRLSRGTGTVWDLVRDERLAGRN